MTLADDLKAILPGIRAIPGSLGLRPHAVALIERSWAGAVPGEGNIIDTEAAITEGDSQPPKVRWLNNEEIAVGGVDPGTVEIGPITSAGGISLATLRLDLAEQGSARYIRITGPMHPSGAKYRVTKILAEKAMHWMIQAKPVDASE